MTTINPEYPPEMDFDLVNFISRVSKYRSLYSHLHVWHPMPDGRTLLPAECDSEDMFCIGGIPSGIVLFTYCLFMSNIMFLSL